MTDIDIEAICRTYVHVEARNTPYASELSELSENFHNINRTKIGDYREKLNLAHRDLENIGTTSLRDSIKGDIAGLLSSFRREEGVNLDKILKHGEYMSSTKTKLEALVGIVDALCNEQSKVITSVGTLNRGLRDYKRKFKKEMGELGEEIISLHKINSDHDERGKYLDSLIESSTKIQKKLAKVPEGSLEERREALKEDMIQKSYGELISLSEKFLQRKNDLILMETQTGLDKMLKSYNEVANSLTELRKKVYADVEGVQGVIDIYELITAMQMDSMKNFSLPEEYIGEVRKLIRGIEKVDEGYSKRVLQVLINGQKAPSGESIQFNDVIKGLASEIMEKGGNGQE